MSKLSVGRGSRIRTCGPLLPKNGGSGPTLAKSGVIEQFRVTVFPLGSCQTVGKLGRRGFRGLAISQPPAALGPRDLRPAWRAGKQRADRQRIRPHFASQRFLVGCMPAWEPKLRDKSVNRLSAPEFDPKRS